MRHLACVVRGGVVLAGMVLAVMAIATSIAVGGPLFPPIGPVTSTGPTLQQIEPGVEINSDNTPGDATAAFRITQPGRYYLSSNINLRTNVLGIAIASSDVTIDMRGFGVRMQGAFPGGIATVEPAARNVTVRNGYILAGTRGLDLRPSGGSAVGARVEQMTIRESSGGLRLPIGGQAKWCSVFDSFGGINATEGCLVSECVVEGFVSSNTGFTGELGAEFVGCRAVGVFRGFLLNSGSRATDCVATNSASIGFEVSDRSTVQRCTTRGGGGFDIISATAIDCEAMDFTSIGFDVQGSNARLEGCVVSTDATTAADGFVVIGNKHTLMRCVVRRLAGSQSRGFVIGTVRGLVEECVSQQAGLTGFLIGGSETTVLRCRNLDTSGFLISPGNYVAPVVNVTSIGTNTNPHANFTR
jgi:hypothetical protein